MPALSTETAKKQQAKSDLTPDADGRAPRTRCWSAILTTKHESFHVSDWKSYHKTECDKFRTDVHTYSADVTAQKLSPENVLSAEISNSSSGFTKKYIDATNAAHNAYDPEKENRAYADGKASYQSLADSIQP